jgi:TPR repeat protein
MKAIAMVLVALQVVGGWSAHAQSARKLTERITGPGKPISPPPPPAPQPVRPPSPAAAPVPSLVPAKDPQKAAAEKEAQLRKVIEFQQQRAEKGSPTAQYDLGMRYLTGDGLEADLQLAKKWLQAAAKQGHKMAAKRLEEISAWEAAAKRAPSGEGEPSSKPGAPKEAAAPPAPSARAAGRSE